MKIYFKYKLLLFIFPLSVVSCGLPDNNLNAATDSCPVDLKNYTWYKSVSPNISVFSQSKIYYSIKVPTANCQKIFNSTNNLRVSLNLKSTVNQVVSGEGLVFVSINAENKAAPLYVAENTKFYFNSDGVLNRTIINSKENADWTPPLKNLSAYFVLTFMIPVTIENSLNYYPKGTILFENVK